MKLDRNWYLIAIAVVLASILLPFMQAGSFAGNVVESTVVYRDGWFGPYIERVTLDNGAVTHVTRYPWYYFRDLSSPSMRIVSLDGGSFMSGGSSSGRISINVYEGDGVVPVTIGHQNTGDFITYDVFGLGDKTVKKSRLVMYKGDIETWKKLSPLVAPWDDLVWSYGPYEYLDQWETVVTFDPWYYRGGDTMTFTIVETQYPRSLVGYETGVGYVDVSVLKTVDPDDPTDPIVVGGVGTIRVKVFDDMINRPATVNVYKDGVFVKTKSIIDDGFVFDNLKFGRYRFEVIDADYETWFYDASPHQSDFNFDIGDVELSAEFNTISYFVYGDFLSTESEYYEGGDNSSDDERGNTSRIEEFLNETKGKLGLETGDGTLALADIITMIGALLASIGLLTSVAIIGLPIFIVVILFLLGAAFVKSGDKKPNQKYSPGNKKGGRKR